MRKLSFILIMFSFIGLTSAQTNYDEIGQFDIYQIDWALVKLNGKLGFIDNNGKEIVEPIYDKIEKFDIHYPDLAKVEINNKQGFINEKGEFITNPK